MTSKEKRIVNTLSKPMVFNAPKNSMILPNHSGKHDAGIVNKTAVNDNDLVNKAYVDGISINTGIDLFAYDAASSDIGGYKQLQPNPSSGEEKSGVVEIAGNTEDVAIGSRATETDYNAFAQINTLTAGIYNFHIHMKAENTLRLRVYVKFYVRSSGGSETLITTSPISEFIGITSKGYDLHATLSEEYPLVAGDRIVVKAFANNSHPSPSDLTVYVEGDTATRITIRSLSTQKSHSSLLNLDYASAGHTGDLVVEDHGTAATDMVVNVSYGTSDTPPTATTTTIGSLYIKYTA